MVQIGMLRAITAVCVVLLPAVPTVADEVEGCHFVWDVSHELAVMKQTPVTVAAGVKAGAEAPLLQLDKLYDLKLPAQAEVIYAAKLAKPTQNGTVRGGVARFHSGKAGPYRISITSGLWVDVVDGTRAIKSRDFTRARGCDRPSKIVEFDLPASRDLTLQLSGSTDATVLLSITPVSGPATH